ncbi:polysaccharide deacetylase family protein [Microbacterium sp. ASV49]|uniref:Polysaccharide deacetylase family protein n=1 Tax=Microbacterium candidum TaxID=3041922 RepID=A0ABT7MXW6_9MICO|nr:polysaccharide deacetylase family protein [Microbacterium sp. ASV49]MDL9979289.1 polysaccharide deacetylase family protein [Microbacterium sp. ASV49]
MPSSSRRPRPIAWILVGAAGLVVATLVVTGVAAAFGGHQTAAAQPTAKPVVQTPTLPPITPLPSAVCMVSFTGQDITASPQEQTVGALYAGLPIPERAGYVFAGWYRSAADASSLNAADRVNGAQIVQCASGPETLYGGWMTTAAVAAAKVRVPVLMYHQFTTKPQGEKTWLKANFDYIGDFENNMAYLSDQKFYLPTWDELNAFIDGKLYLPKKSVVVTDDDADPTWETLAVPIVTKYKVLATSFVITSARKAPSPSVYVLQRSHTDNMHSAGANGKGKMVNYTYDQVVADLKTSVTVLGGVTEAFAYPYGQFNDTAEKALHDVGFWMAFTTKPGYVVAGAKKLELPRERMSFGMTMTQFKDIVG